ncbi:ubiquitin-specific protease ubp15 [Pleodorina starrii]|uniref:Ubiquitin-specific protease ubp15 n=1 Tax=Pleodorina starrii TaxID=330485 RepID=A0A9W6C2G4_9CHLO|nr:ubiquitin-specific protease ubp15 [Pleodorina starrii]GLC62255.1 ubiquitin-specific protease ubp15 [Pleodorina starrii]GLC77355.1 ubiquitin-specific protease ubp15 [Pleodorina starrii]
MFDKDPSDKFALTARNALQPPKLSKDILALLDNPGPTSDLTLIAAGGRSFPVHRAILVARCEFFKTMFASDVGDAASARELPLPDADPDALALLLRFIYGGVLDKCEHDQLKPAMELADFLRLVWVCAKLQQRLLDTVTQDTLAEDLLWAEGRGDEDTLTALVRLCVRKFAATGADAIADVLAERSPKLLARLFKQLAADPSFVKPPQAAPLAPVFGPAPKGFAGLGGFGVASQAFGAAPASAPAAAPVTGYSFGAPASSTPASSSGAPSAATVFGSIFGPALSSALMLGAAQPAAVGAAGFGSGNLGAAPGLGTGFTSGVPAASGSSGSAAAFTTSGFGAQPASSNPVSTFTSSASSSAPAFGATAPASTFGMAPAQERAFGMGAFGTAPPSLG